MTRENVHRVEVSIGRLATNAENFDAAMQGFKEGASGDSPTDRRQLRGLWPAYEFGWQLGQEQRWEASKKAVEAIERGTLMGPKNPLDGVVFEEGP